MNKNTRLLFGVAAVLLSLSATQAATQPSDGSVLPFEPMPSASVAKPRLQDSVHKRRAQPEHLKTGAPNVLIVLLDDVGFGQASTFGGEINTPTLSKLAKEGISAEVRQNPNAIGYDGLGYVTPDQKVLGVAGKGGGRFVLPSVDTVNDGTYPISRDLYMYTAGEPQGTVASYLDYILGEGQAVVPTLGFVPLAK